MSKILSFDVSSVSTGWAFLFNGNLQSFGTITPHPTFRLQEKLYWFKNETGSLLRVFEPDHVIIEETYLKNVRTLKVLMQFVAVLHLECFSGLEGEPIFVSPNTVRSHFELKTKEDVFEYVKNKYKVKLKKYDFKSGNDITDAILQALYWSDALNEEGENNMTKEIIPNYKAQNIGLVSFRYMQKDDMHEYEHDPIKVRMYSLTGINKVDPGYAGSTFLMGKSQITVIVDDEEKTFDNEKVALVWDQLENDYDVVDMEFIYDIHKYAFILEDKFFEDRDEANNYFRSFIITCYEGWVSRKKKELLNSDDQEKQNG